ncbi:MAG TPA: hypothetical protein VJR89_22380 [Polyangiales bacterium]|nr:hypothetical protein [Polyangiales bacterium]
MCRTIVAGAACWLFSCAWSPSTSDTKVIVDVDDTLTGFPRSPQDSFVVPALICPAQETECWWEANRAVISPLSDRAGPTFDVVVRGLEVEEPESEAARFWRDVRRMGREVARVGLRTGFITGASRFVHIVPTFGCLQSTEAIPEIDPKRLGTERRPLVLDGCGDESEADDAGVDAAAAEDGGPAD